MNLVYTYEMGRAFVEQALPELIKDDAYKQADWWYSIVLKDGTLYDVNYMREEDEPAYVVFYALDLNEHGDNSYNVFTRRVPVKDILTLCNFLFIE